LQPETLGEVARQLKQRGYAQADIDAIFGDNFMRVAKSTWPAPHVARAI
jgi:membrane dipeptidase